MSADQYVLWFVLMAVGIALVLGLGTLKMAGLLGRPGHHAHAEAADRQQAEPEADHPHHWYDLFHHAA